MKYPAISIGLTLWLSRLSCAQRIRLVTYSWHIHDGHLLGTHLIVEVTVRGYPRWLLATDISLADYLW